MSTTSDSDAGVVRPFAEFLTHNQRTYNLLAHAYAQRIPTDSVNDLPLVGRFWSHLRSRRPTGTIELLDLGCGHGVNVALFGELGAHVTGLDFATSMLEVAKCLSPDSDFINGEFLSTSIPHDVFDAVFAKAFIHLFPKVMSRILFQKIYEILAPDGLLYIATTLSDTSSEGYIPKSDYPGSPARFRHIWSRDELIQHLASVGFERIDEWVNTEPAREKTWLNLVLGVGK